MAGAGTAETQALGAGRAAVPELRAQIAGPKSALLHTVTCHVSAAAALVAAHRRRLKVGIEIPATWATGVGVKIPVGKSFNSEALLRSVKDSHL